MILYHFTSFRAFGSERNPNKGTIWRNGILPPKESGFEGIGTLAPEYQPLDCVWLTREEFPIWYVQNGKPAVPDVRITVRLPTTDKQLVRYERWMLDRLSREMMKGAVDTVESTAPCSPGGGWRHWYCYFGIIPRSRIKGEHLAGCFNPDPVRRAAFIEQHRESRQSSKVAARLSNSAHQSTLQKLA